MNEEYLEYFIPQPAILCHMDRRVPLCNKGAKAPPPPPPVMAPYEEVEGMASPAATAAVRNRRGLKSTIMSMFNRAPMYESTLGMTQPVLGQRSDLRNTPPISQPK